MSDTPADGMDGSLLEISATPQALDPAHQQTQVKRKAAIGQGLSEQHRQTLARPIATADDHTAVAAEHRYPGLSESDVHDISHVPDVARHTYFYNHSDLSDDAVVEALADATGGRGKNKRKRAAQEQFAELVTGPEELPADVADVLAKKLKLSNSDVEAWFQQRRAIYSFRTAGRNVNPRAYQWQAATEARRLSAVSGAEASNPVLQRRESASVPRRPSLQQVTQLPRRGSIMMMPMQRRPSLVYNSIMPPQMLPYPHLAGPMGAPLPPYFATPVFFQPTPGMPTGMANTLSSRRLSFEGGNPDLAGLHSSLSSMSSMPPPQLIPQFFGPMPYSGGPYLVPVPYATPMPPLSSSSTSSSKVPGDIGERVAAERARRQSTEAAMYEAIAQNISPFEDPAKRARTGKAYSTPTSSSDRG